MPLGGGVEGDKHRHFLWGFRPKCGLLIPNPLFINVFAISLYMCAFAIYTLGCFGQAGLAGF